MGKVGAFGPVAFEVSNKYVRTFDQLQETRRARYAKHDVLSLDSKLQWLGTDLTEAVLPMKFHSSYSDPGAERAKLAKMLVEHVAHPLVIGGANLGNFVIEELGATWNHVSNKGVLVHVTIDARLKEYH